MVANGLQEVPWEEFLARFGEAVEVQGEGNRQIITVAPSKIRDFLRDLRYHPQLNFNYLVDLTAVDNPEDMSVVYQLISLANNARVEVKVRLSKEDPEVPSVVEFWPGADWLERETFDLLGVRFSGHPNLSRILLTEDFEGHPLRKEYKLAPRK